MRALAIFGLLIGAPALGAQSQSGTPPPATTPSSNPWATLPAVSPYRNLAEEIGAVSTHKELQGAKQIQASEPKTSCDTSKGEACPKEPPKH